MVSLGNQPRSKTKESRGQEKGVAAQLPGSLSSPVAGDCLFEIGTFEVDASAIKP